MLLTATFVILLFLLATFDFKVRRLPNVLVFSITLLGFYVAWQVGDIASKILASAVGFLAFYLIRITYQRVRNLGGIRRTQYLIVILGAERG